ncbi:MAG TPA: glycosyltransferase [Elusimicrobia bacterium]|nr:glycosyltransferase [Elusimicrobiota bacterium]
MTTSGMSDCVFSVVIPVYNSEQIIGETISRTVAFFKQNGLRYQLVVVNDDSRDRSWEIVKEIAGRTPGILAIDLLKNYGQHNAVLCGFRHAVGDFIITLDDDLQNPPEEIIKLIEKAGEGYDAVFGRFIEKKHALVRRLGSRLVGYLNSRIFDKPDGITLSNFRIIRRDVIRRMLNYNTPFPYIPGLVLMFSSRIANVSVRHEPRAIGDSNYCVVKIITLLATLLFGYSPYPMRVLCGIGFVISGISFALGLVSIYRGLFVYRSPVPGWTSLIVLLSFLLGYVILLLGIVGEYLVRVLNQLSSNRSFHIRETIAGDNKA